MLLRTSVLIAFVALLFSCKKDSNVGSTLISNSDKFYGTMVDTFTVEAYTEIDTIAITEGLQKVVVGEINDPEFGIAKAQWFLQMVPQGTLSFGTNPSVDSIVLSFRVDTSYGESNQSTFRAYELSDDFVSGTYYSNHTVNYGAEIGNAVFTGDSGVVRIKLSNTLAQKIINTTGDTLSVSSTFLKLFKGLRIKAEQTSLNTSEGKLCLINPANAATQLTLYYGNNAGKQTTVLKMTSTTRHFVNFQHDYTVTTDLKNQLSNKSLGANRLFLQPLFGTHIVLKFPYLSKWFEESKVMIQRAEVVFPIESGSNSIYRTPNFLFATYGQGDTLLTEMLSDYDFGIPNPSEKFYVKGQGYSITNGGKFEGDKYRLAITKFIARQLFIKTNNELKLTAAGRSLSVLNTNLHPYRVVLAGTNKNNPVRTKLVLYYSK